MKKFFLLCFVLSALGGVLTAQQNATVDINDDIYYVLSIAQDRGLCDYFSGARPYSVKRIKYAVEQILENQEKLKPSELKVIENFLERYVVPEKNSIGPLKMNVSNHKDKWHFSFNYDFGFESSGSGGLYTNS